MIFASFGDLDTRRFNFIDVEDSSGHLMHLRVHANPLDYLLIDFLLHLDFRNYGQVSLQLLLTVYGVGISLLDVKWDLLFAGDLSFLADYSHLLFDQLMEFRFLNLVGNRHLFDLADIHNLLKDLLDGQFPVPVSYTHLTLPTTPYV